MQFSPPEASHRRALKNRTNLGNSSRMGSPEKQIRSALLENNIPWESHLLPFKSVTQQEEQSWNQSWNLVDTDLVPRYNNAAPAKNAGAIPCIPNFPTHRRSAWEIARAVWRSEDWRGFMKYAIVEDGGKQYKAVEGETIEVDRFQAEIGEQVDLDHVLLISEGDKISVGTPYLEGVKIVATVEEQVKGPKIVVFKYKPRVRYRVKTGHRQRYTRLRIGSIEEKSGGKNGS
jgi:large subunit ribosomal protein L21